MLASSRWVFAAATVVAAWVCMAGVAAACGCFNPPIPPPGVTADQFAVAQQAEQIIFEVEDGFITAHVLIRYEGKPDSFAWLLPVPSEPELDLSENIAFALIDDGTSPNAAVNRDNLCPVANYRCERHPSPRCGTPDPPGGGPGFDAGVAGGDTSSGGPPPDAPPVDVISRQIIGSYDTVVFAAADAMAAVMWLQDEGFIVNDTTTPYMQPYLDAGMLFVASKLIPGAGVEEIKPLQMRYAADNPMIPLQLTAVAAEPHLTVTAFIYGDSAFEPIDQPMTEIDETRISVDADNRNNYPMVLSRAVDDAGGDAFVVEYDGAPPISSLGQDACCQGDFDNCFVQGDGQCQCPMSEFDAEDCAEIEGLTESLELMTGLAERHTHMTRLTTRLSAEEMTFDPAFQAGASHGLTSRLSVIGQRSFLNSCTSDIMDPDLYDEIEARQGCATVYCGTGGECAVTDGRAGCVCDAGSAARAFTDADGERSVTCVPDTPPVDFGAGGLAVPDACSASVDCGDGACIDLGGFPACRCNPGAAAVAMPGMELPTCLPVVEMAGSPGAEDFSGPLATVRVCAPAPPSSCGDYGWLVETEGGIRGEACESSIPDPMLLEIPDPPVCTDLGLPPALGGGGGCSTVAPAISASKAIPAGLGLLGLALGLVFVRRRH